jgi:hypothetical protein
MYVSREKGRKKGKGRKGKERKGKERKGKKRRNTSYTVVRGTSFRKSYSYSFLPLCLLSFHPSFVPSFLHPSFVQLSHFHLAAQWQYYQEGRKDGRREGRREGGRREGRKGGRTAGRQDGRTAGRQDGRTAGRKDFNASDHASIVVTFTL